MLSANLVPRLSQMPFRPDAELRVSYLPLGSIYWTDELDEIVDELITAEEADGGALLRLFRIRVRIWEGEPLTDADRQFFEEARAQVPGYALFHRLQISEEDLQVHREVAQETAEFWTAFFGSADEGPAVQGEGSMRFSAEFDLADKDGA